MVDHVTHSEIIILAHKFCVYGYVLLGGALFANVLRTVRSAMARDEFERCVNFILVGFTVYACALDHGAASYGASLATQQHTAILEAFSVFVTTTMLLSRVILRMVRPLWRG